MWQFDIVRGGNMKKLLIVLAGFAALGSVAFGQTNQVLSRNAVGYEALVVPSNKFNMVRLDFVNLDGATYTVTNLIGDQLPQNSSVFIWNRSSSSYIAENKTRSGWGPGTNPITRGVGMFLKAPSGTGVSNQYTVYFMGEVPDAITSPTTTISGITGVNLHGYPYPADVFWTNTGLAKNGQQNDTLYLWDITNQSYIAYNRTRSGWGTGTNVILRPGQAFWYISTTTQTWSEVKPYTWP
jgi:hypothetical protein